MKLKGKALPRRQLTKKAEIDALFAALCDRYLPECYNRVFLPDRLIAQARVWRGQELPDPQALTGVLEALAVKGLSHPKSGLLIALGESLFRPLRALERALERTVPALLQRSGAGNSLTPGEKELLANEFRRQWKEQESWEGTHWVLAAGSTLIPIRGRPPLVAPWVVGVTLKRALAFLSVDESEAQNLALRFTTVLLGRPTRPEEFQVWETRLDTILVPTDSGAVPLPSYLLQLARVADAPTFLAQELTAASFLSAEWFPPEVCQEIAGVVSRCQSANHTRRRYHPPSRRATQARVLTEAATIPTDEQDPDESGGHAFSVSCALCDLKEQSPERIWSHLETLHQVSHEDLDIREGRKEICRKSTGQLLATWHRLAG